MAEGYYGRNRARFLHEMASSASSGTGGAASDHTTAPGSPARFKQSRPRPFSQHEAYGNDPLRARDDYDRHVAAASDNDARFPSAVAGEYFRPRPEQLHWQETNQAQGRNLANPQDPQHSRALNPSDDHRQSQNWSRSNESNPTRPDTTFFPQADGHNLIHHGPPESHRPQPRCYQDSEGCYHAIPLPAHADNLRGHELSYGRSPRMGQTRGHPAQMYGYHPYLRPPAGDSDSMHFGSAKFENHNIAGGTWSSFNAKVRYDRRFRLVGSSDEGSEIAGPNAFVEKALPSSQKLPCASKKSCRNCLSDNSPLWRTDFKAPAGTNRHLCNACGLYMRKFGCDRPRRLWNGQQSD